MRMLRLLVMILCFVIESRALASPPTPSREDALASGDVDVEDVATESPFARLPPGRRTALPSSTDSVWLTLTGFAHRTIDDRREVGGFVVLGLPLDRLTRPAPRLTPPAVTPTLTQALALSSSDLQRSSDFEQPFDLALTPRLARACVAAAWRAAGLGADDARLDAIVSRARWSAVLPEARLRAVRFDDARLSLDTSTDTSKLRDSTGANVGFEARLTWRFDRLLYADDEPAFERIRSEHRDARARIGARVLEALFHWQRAALDLRTLPPSQQGTRDEADVRLRVIEAGAALDVLTNGWFTAYGAKAVGRASYAVPVPITKEGDL